MTERDKRQQDRREPDTTREQPPPRSAAAGKEDTGTQPSPAEQAREQQERDLASGKENPG
ncbi:MAG: hypothetical protein ACTHMJ_15665 [Thermomicrobiales bacterium]